MTEQAQFPILQKIGLSENEAKLYELLLIQGKTRARDLFETSKLGRGNVYNILNSLKAKGLVLSVEGKQQVFEAVDPTKLESMIQKKVTDIQMLRSEFTASLPQLASIFNLSTGKPTIEIFEGLEGIERALEDSLQSKSLIKTMGDPNLLKGEVADLNGRYTKKRIRQKIRKQLLVPDRPELRKMFADYEKEFSTIRYLPDFFTNTKVTAEIYGNTVVFVIVREQKIFAVIVRDEAMAHYQESLFDYLWNQAAS
ncbi:MAG: helix-turn-helix domain-containing protein [Patescibacteria group bacterium]|jgi:sugar-specific transcriptional regulator TrmB